MEVFPVFLRIKYLRVVWLLLLFAFFSMLVGCNNEPSVTAQDLIDQSIATHGMKGIYGKKITFEFRERTYTLQKDSTHFVYERIAMDEGDTILDALHSSYGHKRLINGKRVDLPDSLKAKYSASVNSVLYFVQIPLVLKDPAVNAEYLGFTTIKDRNYHTLKITFSEENGGEDFQDEYRYWIDEATREVDYLAYSYHTDEGGVRFREAFDKNRVEGILFQNYRNFMPEGAVVPLDSLPVFFERNQLKLLSTIENTDFRVIDIESQL